MNDLLNEEQVLQLIHKIRNQKVMLDSDLAEMYGVATKRLNEQVKRNSDRFPEDFMFQLNEEEWRNLKSQFATSRWGGRRTLPYDFTEQGGINAVFSAQKSTSYPSKYFNHADIRQNQRMGFKLFRIAGKNPSIARC